MTAIPAQEHNNRDPFRPQHGGSARRGARGAMGAHLMCHHRGGGTARRGAAATAVSDEARLRRTGRVHAHARTHLYWPDVKNDTRRFVRTAHFAAIAYFRVRRWFRLFLRLLFRFGAFCCCLCFFSVVSFMFV